MTFMRTTNEIGPNSTEDGVKEAIGITSEVTNDYDTLI